MSEPSLRLRRILDPVSGRALLVSFTAAMEVGVVPGLADLPDAVAKIAGHSRITGAVVHAGVLDSVFARCSDLPSGAVVDLFGGTWMTTRPDRREQICTLEHAVRAGADAVLATIGLGGPDESRQLRLCGQIARDSVAWGMPLIVRIDTTETDARRQYSATLAGLGARMAYELGADLAIVNYSGSLETFRDALRGIAIPVLLGGAPDLAGDDALLRSVSEALQAGAQGAALPATMLWRDGPTETLAKLSQLVLGPERRR